MDNIPAIDRMTTTALLERLVAYDTTSRNTNLALIGFVRDDLDPIAQAHQRDAWMAQSALDACDRFVRRSADRLLV